VQILSALWNNVVALLREEEGRTASSTPGDRRHQRRRRRCHCWLALAGIAQDIATGMCSAIATNVPGFSALSCYSEKEDYF